MINLLRLLRGDLRALDLSRLAIRQAHLAEVDAQDASLVDAHLAEALLADAFDLPMSVALSRDGALLAAGTSTGHVWLWRVADRTPLWAVQGHTGGAFDVTLSVDGHLLASGGADGTVRVWDASTNRQVARLHGHTGTVWGVALSADAHRQVSQRPGGMDFSNKDVLTFDGSGTLIDWETGILAAVQPVLRAQCVHAGTSQVGNLLAPELCPLLSADPGGLQPTHSGQV